MRYVLGMKHTVDRYPRHTNLEKNLVGKIQPEPILIYEGKFPNIVQLDKIRDICNQVFVKGYYPVCNLRTLRQIISDVAGKDFRTQDKYLVCIRTFIISTTGKQFTYYSNWNLTGLYSTIQDVRKIRVEQARQHYEDKKLRERERYRINPRIWCGSCHTFKKKNGGCNCAGS